MKTFGKGLNNMKNVAKKLLQFQTEVGAIKKDSDNPFYKSKYFNIDTLIDVIKPVLNKVGLILLQPLISVDGKPSIKTQIIDSESGESIESTIELPPFADAQKMGSIITYLRRYSITSMLFLEAEDDDGNSVSNGQNSTKTAPPNNFKPKYTPPPVKPSDKPLKTKEDMAKEEVKKLCDEVALSTLTVIKTKEDYEKFVKEKTGFDLKPEFYNMIITRLKSIKSANEFEKDLGEPVKT